ncbi:oxidoreductase [Mycobacterium sp. MS1601]|uniref:oxidoreductase n=1 Tax=Mycobacterium sp. MS1601 TaxID=1936029 RepID=UPI0009FA8E93|nr:NADH:flavin oxidoreductase [Mycobacterium sp. MS1601]
MPDPLLEPLTIGSVTIKNRIFSSGHAPAGYLDINDQPGLRYALYQEEKARGGAGLVMFGGSSYVDADSRSHFGAFDASSDEIVPFYQDLADRLHRHGAKTFVQITHLGRRGDDKSGSWLPTISPSGVRERAHRSYPKTMEDFDFKRVQRKFVEAALRAQAGGLDGVEISAHAGHLLDQFFADRTNYRDDEYGTRDLESRMRFALEVLAAVRAAVGTEFVVGLRIPGDEGSATGISPDDCVRIAQRFASTGQVDYFSVVYGSGFTHRELADLIPPTGRELGGHLPVAARIRASVDIPVIHAGRIADLATARYAIRENLVDMVGMTRAHIADPHIVRKLESGQEERIRPCVGASQCLSAETLCIHNPATGREETIPHLTTPSTVSLRVVVVGGGPGGLEAARVSAERGHRVTLFEASSQLGGQVLPMSRTHRQSEKRSITEWLAAEARHAGAELKVDHYVDGEDVLALEPDVVIVATGGLHRTDLPDGGGHLVQTTVDVLSRGPGSNTAYLVYDDHGGEQALTAAEHLLSGEGNTVEIVTVDGDIGFEVGHTIIPDFKRILFAAGATVVPNNEVRSVTKTDGKLSVSLMHIYTDQTSTLVADVVVVEQGTEPNTDVYEQLREKSTNRGEVDLELFKTGIAQASAGSGFQLFRIGDAVSHRGVHSAIYDARRLCMNL